MRKIPFRREREGKTDYRKRLKLLKSGKPRLVIRKTDHYIIAQIVKFGEKGDITLASANSKELLKYGYDGGLKNTTAAYLTGLLIGSRGLRQTKEAIVDIGLHSSTRGGKVYAVVKGAIDAGMQIPCDESMFPSDDRIDMDKVEKVRRMMS